MRLTHFLVTTQKIFMTHYHRLKGFTMRYKQSIQKTNKPH